MQKSFQILESFWLSEAFPFPKFFRLIWRLATWWRCRRMQVTTEELPGQLRIDTAVSHRCAPNRFNPTCLHRIPRCKEGSKAWSHLIIGWCLAVSKSCHGLSFMTVFVAWYCLFHCDMFLPNFGHCLAFVFWVSNPARETCESFLPSIGAHQSCDKAILQRSVSRPCHFISCFLFKLEIRYLFSPNRRGRASAVPTVHGGLFVDTESRIHCIVGKHLRLWYDWSAQSLRLPFE